MGGREAEQNFGYQTGSCLLTWEIGAGVHFLQITLSYFFFSICSTWSTLTAVVLFFLCNGSIIMTTWKLTLSILEHKGRQHQGWLALRLGSLEKLFLCKSAMNLLMKLKE